jgi:SAM-dependent methyltransferase
VAVLYGPSFRRTWSEALCLPGFDDLFESLAAELSEFLGIAPDDAKVRMEQAWSSRAELGRAARDAGSDPEALRAYYRHQEHGLFVSSYWHSLRPDSYALHSVAALQDCMQFSEGDQVFEFGHGIGSTGLLFAARGFKVTLGDLSAAYRDFARYRFRRRGLEAAFLDLAAETPPAAAFDAVVSLDVLEHIPSPLPTVEMLHRSLKPGGVLVLNVVFGLDPSNPEHLLSRRVGVLDRFRSIGFERLPSTLLTYYQRPLGRGRRMLYRAQDLVDAGSTDLARAGFSLPWRLFHVMVPPDRLG